VLEWFARFSRKASAAAGSWQAFVAACTLVLAWLIGGFFVGFGSELYQLLINTITTIVTFLIVFLIQGSQNRDTSALHAKVDALICAIKEADDEMIRIEDGSDDQLAQAREKTKAASGRS
jgi:low affinity Fe/Cu permease